MTRQEYRRLLQSIPSLTRSQKQRLLDDLKKQLCEEQSINLIEQSFEALHHCPHCGSERFCRWGRANGLQRYRCRSCTKTFNALTATPLARLRYKARWMSYCECLAEGYSVRRAAAHCGIDKTTAFRWRHRFLRRPTQNKASKMHGIVEADETFFAQSHKGDKHLRHRPARTRGNSLKRRRCERVPVLIVRDRSGSVADFVFEHLEKAKVHACLRPLMSQELVLCTDGNSLYQTFAEAENIAHKRVVGLSRVRVIDKVFHIQNLNAYMSRLKDWMLRFNGVSTKYLPNYLGWRRLLEKQHNPMPAACCLSEALGRVNTNC